jgi:hypothetical protein
VIIRVSRQPGIRYVARCCGAGWHRRARPARVSIRMRWWTRQWLQTQPWTYPAFVPCIRSSRREAVSAASNAAAQRSSVLVRPQT